MIFRRKSKEPGEAEMAVENANKSLRVIKARTKEVDDLSKDLRFFRERNHFSEQLTIIITGHVGGGYR